MPIRIVLEILRLIWSDRRQSCAATSQRAAPAGHMSSNDTRCAPWITKQRLAEHLSVTPRWIELQQRRGLPHIHTPGLNRYRISEVEAWLREQYGWSQAQ
jgi:hypothetical protein